MYWKCEGSLPSFKMAAGAPRTGSSVEEGRRWQRDVVGGGDGAVQSGAGAEDGQRRLTEPEEAAAPQQ